MGRRNASRQSISRDAVNPAGSERTVRESNVSLARQADEQHETRLALDERRDVGVR